jgi:hypothetical protein
MIIGGSRLTELEVGLEMWHGVALSGLEAELSTASLRSPVVAK